MTYRHLYVRTVLNLYLQLPNTSERSSLKDRQVADRFFDLQIPIEIVESALLLGSARRMFFYPGVALPPIRSLAYFQSLVEELLPQPFPPECLASLRTRDDDDSEDDFEDPPLPF